MTNIHYSDNNLYIQKIILSIDISNTTHSRFKMIW